MNPPDPSQTEIDANAEKQVSLGPACLVVFVIGALFISVAMIVAASMIMGNQGILAAKALENQLIPWVEKSSLEETDRRSIVRELEDLVVDLREDRLDERQMIRLKTRIADSPVLQWGAIQSLQKKIQMSGLTEHEKMAAEKELDRFLKCAREMKLAMQQMEFVVQKVASKERQSGRLTALDEPSDSDLRNFLRRVKELCDNAQVSEDDFQKSPSQVFHMLVEDALSGKEDAR